MSLEGQLRRPQTSDHEERLERLVKARFGPSSTCSSYKHYGFHEEVVRRLVRIDCYTPKHMVRVLSIYFIIDSRPLGSYLLASKEVEEQFSQPLWSQSIDETIK